ncbi:TetR family transcriptional regulator [Skermanella stibiiresistens SB22]|uniref:TetR family transcriptional regulator n=1 Tax=Skermanella stibiiresistens SB22 TaxID=1385369 RepID=W9H9M4_9PROT|nr:TetR/AcrR family transcriptional regulator [Skermanella stibiiresistens]EWY41456.1 TetR family transcriptional regulator [Skermanella stibiiresistens SB22]
MRYEKGHKETTRRRILDVASGRFRRDGVDAVGLAGLMADAGLTHGGFYAHFKSKEDLIREAVTDALGQTTKAYGEKINDKDWDFETIVRHYLSPPHRDNPEKGCVAACLTAEIARHSDETRAAFSGRAGEMIDMLGSRLGPGDPLAIRRRATAIFALLVGTLQLARAEVDSGRSGEILESGIAAALELRQVPGVTP